MPPDVVTMMLTEPGVIPAGLTTTRAEPLSLVMLARMPPMETLAAHGSQVGAGDGERGAARRQGPALGLMPLMLGTAT